MENRSTEFEVPRAIQTVAALGGLAIDAYLAAHANRQARLGAPQSAPKKQPFAEVLRQAGSSIPGLQDALVALAGEEHAADVKKLAELVSENGDLGELVRKATMNARGAVAADTGAAPATAPTRPAGGSDLHAALGTALARGEEAESRARLLAMLQSSVEERLALMEARLDGRVSALQQRVIHLEASIDGLAQDIERLKQRVRMRRDTAASRAASSDPEAASASLPGATGEPATASPRSESTHSSAEVSGVTPRVESVLSASEPTAPAPRRESVPSSSEATAQHVRSASTPGAAEAAALDAKVPPAAEGATASMQRAQSTSVEGAVTSRAPAVPPADQAEPCAVEEPEQRPHTAGGTASTTPAPEHGLMAMLDARERQHDVRITEGEQVVASLSEHVTTLMAQVRSLSAELDHDA